VELRARRTAEPSRERRLSHAAGRVPSSELSLVSTACAEAARPVVQR